MTKTIKVLLLVFLFAILVLFPYAARGQDVTETPTAEVTPEITPTPAVSPGDVITIFRPEFTNLAATALALLVGVFVFVLGRYGVPVARLKAWGAQYDWLVDIAYNTVARLRVTADELTEYQQEATATGRDVRLVAAYREIEELANDFGIPFHLTLTISLIERILDEQQRDAGEKA